MKKARMKFDPIKEKLRKRAEREHKKIETNEKVEKAEMFFEQEGREKNGPLKEAKSIQSNATT